MTEKLYYIDSYTFSCTADVLECRKAKSGYETRLDKTVFFPEGGGQGGDKGYIGDVRIIDTHEKDGEIWHCSEVYIENGTYECKIDADLRLSRMQCHSGEHIISGLIHTLFGLDNVGFHLSENDVTIDINGVLTEEELSKIETLANEAVAKDFEVKIYFPSKEEAKNIPYRSKLEIEENLRLVEYEGYDICACCAPHVKRTGQIGIIKLLDFANYKGGMRIHILCGMRALEDYRQKYASVLKVSNLLSAKQDEIASAVERLKAENEKTKHDAASLRRVLAEEMANSAEKTDKNLVFFSSVLDAASLRTLVNLATPKCGGICAAFCQSGDVYNYCMASTSIDLKEKSKEINAALSGRGGGSREMICGSVSAAKEVIEEYFK